MRWPGWIALLLFALALSTVTPNAWGQNGEPIPENELPEFLGSVPPDQFAWRIFNGPDFVVYHGKPNPPLVGSIGFYLGFAPQDLEAGQSTIASQLGRFPTKWHRSVQRDGSIHQEAIIALGGVLDMKAHVWAEAPSEDELRKLLLAVGQLPTFSSEAVPARFQSFEDLAAEEQRIRRITWICWWAFVVAVAWLVDRISRRRNVAASLRLVIFAGVIASSIATTIAAVALLPAFTLYWFHRANVLLLLAAAGVILVFALLLAGGLSLVRHFRTRTT